MTASIDCTNSTVIGYYATETEIDSAMANLEDGFADNGDGTGTSTQYVKKYWGTLGMFVLIAIFVLWLGIPLP